MTFHCEPKHERKAKIDSIFVLITPNFDRITFEVIVLLTINKATKLFINNVAWQMIIDDAQRNHITQYKTKSETVLPLNFTIHFCGILFIAFLICVLVCVCALYIQPVISFLCNEKEK